MEKDLQFIIKRDFALIAAIAAFVMIFPAFLMQDTAIKYTNKQKVINALANESRIRLNKENEYKFNLQSDSTNQLANPSIAISNIKNPGEEKDVNKKIAVPQIKAKAFSIYDALKGKELASKESNQLLPLASLTKIFTALAVKEYLNESDTVTLKESDLQTEGEYGLILNSHWNPYELARFMLMVSSNDAAAALGRTLEEKLNKKFPEIIKDLSQKIGINVSFVLNPSGLDLSYETGGGYGTAKEISKTMAFASQNAPEIFEVTSKKEFVFYDEEGREYHAKNTNQDIEFIFNPVASKTGYTDLAGGNLSVAFEVEPRHLIVITVLGSDKENRFKDVEKLYNALIDYFAK